MPNDTLLTDEQIREALGAHVPEPHIARRALRDLLACREALRDCISDFEFIERCDPGANFQASILKGRDALGETNGE